MMGTKKFVELCRKLEKKYGARFAPKKLLLDLADKNETFYGRFAPKTKAAACICSLHLSPGEREPSREAKRAGRGSVFQSTPHPHAFVRWRATLPLKGRGKSEPVDYITTVSRFAARVTPV